MVSLVTLGFGAVLVAYLYNYYRCFSRNLAAAKASGLTYVIVPVYLFNRVWLVTHQLWFIPLRKLPVRWTEPWFELIDPEWTWKELHAPFRKVGADAFLTVSPGGNMLWCADAGAISQITTRRNDFPKPIEIYGSIDLFGKNVVSTEGAVWRHHRKITSPPFTEKNNHLVWAESLHQARCMLKSWVGPDGAANKTVWRVADDTMRLSLHVISRAGFGVRLLWPGVEDTEKVNGHAKGLEGAQQDLAAGVPPGHSMSYTDALGTLLHNILWVLLLPNWLISELDRCGI